MILELHPRSAESEALDGAWMWMIDKLPRRFLCVLRLQLKANETAGCPASDPTSLSVTWSMSSGSTTKATPSRAAEPKL